MTYILDNQSLFFDNNYLIDFNDRKKTYPPPLKKGETESPQCKFL